MPQTVFPVEGAGAKLAGEPGGQQAPQPPARNLYTGRPHDPNAASPYAEKALDLSWEKDFVPGASDEPPAAPTSRRDAPAVEYAGQEPVSEPQTTTEPLYDRPDEPEQPEGGTPDESAELPAWLAEEARNYQLNPADFSTHKDLERAVEASHRAWRQAEERAYHQYIQSQPNGNGQPQQPTAPAPPVSIELPKSVTDELDGEVASGIKTALEQAVQAAVRQVEAKYEPQIQQLHGAAQHAQMMNVFSQLDSFIAGLGDDGKRRFGEGSTLSMDRNSLSFSRRNELLDRADEIQAGAQARGHRVPSVVEALQRVVYGHSGYAPASGKPTTAPAAKPQQTIARAGSKAQAKTQPTTGYQRAVERARNFLNSSGVRVEGGKIDDFR